MFSSDCWAVIISVHVRHEGARQLPPRALAYLGARQDGLGVAVLPPVTIFTCCVLTIPSGKSRMLRFVIQWECFAADAITWMLPGDPVHPKVSRESIDEIVDNIEKCMRLVWVYSNVAIGVVNVGRCHENAQFCVRCPQAHGFGKKFPSSFGA